ncbi:hypothetical protein D3C78_1339060 [compost metagenome]
MLVISMAFLSNSSISLERLTNATLTNMEVPKAPITIRTKSGQGFELLQIVDHENGIHHYMFVKRSLGLLWTNYYGGGFGLELDPDIRLSLRGGMSTFGKHRHYYYVGQVNDPAISSLRIRWGNGFEQEAVVKDGVYQVVRSVAISEDQAAEYEAGGEPRLLAYNSKGELLYEHDLDSMQGEIRY